VLLDSIVNNLLNCLNDPSPVVRQLCLKGLSSLSQLPQEQVKFLLYWKSLGIFLCKDSCWYSDASKLIFFKLYGKDETQKYENHHILYKSRQ